MHSGFGAWCIMHHAVLVLGGLPEAGGACVVSCRYALRRGDTVPSMLHTPLPSRHMVARFWK